MLRDDDSRVPLREIGRWFVPLLMVLLGITLFFVLGQRASPLAAPIRLELEQR
jgi:hypothetical protein